MPPPSAAGLQLLLLNVQDMFADKKPLFIEAAGRIISAWLGVHSFGFFSCFMSSYITQLSTLTKKTIFLDYSEYLLRIWDLPILTFG